MSDCLLDFILRKDFGNLIPPLVWTDILIDWTGKNGRFVDMMAE